MQTEAVPNETSSEAKVGRIAAGPDPMLLGVSLPLSVTMQAATQVKAAWKEALAAVLAAAKEKANAKRASLKKANGASKAEATEIKA